MAALDSTLRKQLEKAIVEARTVAEKGAKRALESLAVHQKEAHASMSADDRKQRNQLRAHGRQLGDKRDENKGTQTIARLVREVAYEHWHRMLFARFLAENDLLMMNGPTGVPITLAECEDLAREQGQDPWALAASYAERMLPQIFRTDDPALALALPPETRQAMQKLLADLPTAVFTADDSLGWTYQFWQAAEKDAVNARVKSGEKITGETLPAVTQLFTEHYMVQFLLHNSIGAWHAGKVLAERPDLAANAQSEQELRDAMRLETANGYDFEYLRFVREPKEGEDLNAGTGPWRPAAGTYNGWPRAAKDLTVLDPCCGSGHFIVAAFELLVRLRMAEEGLDVEAAICAVIADNLFGLELDPRCTQIAAFNLALAAWKLAKGHGALKPIDLPPMRIACSGIGPQASLDDWIEMSEKALADERQGAREPIRRGLEQMHALFRRAPELGSLIDPGELPTVVGAADYDTLRPFLKRVFEMEDADDERRERAIAAQGMADAAEVLVGPDACYTLVITNVPYLGRGSQSDLLKAFADTNYKAAKSDLATIFVDRMLRWVGRSGAVAAVTPQNWLFLTSYKKLRERLLKQRTWDLIARLGPKGFQTPMWDFNVMLAAFSGDLPPNRHLLAGVDAMNAKTAAEKAQLLRGGTVDEGAKSAGMCDRNIAEIKEPSDKAANGTIRLVPQAEQLKNPDASIRLDLLGSMSFLSSIANTWQGLVTTDDNRYVSRYWEIKTRGSTWEWQQSPPDKTDYYSARSCMLRWHNGNGPMHNGSNAHNFPNQQMLKPGVAVRRMQPHYATLFEGDIFHDHVAPIVPIDPRVIPALWCFLTSPQYCDALAGADQQLKIAVASFVKVPFDLEHWQKVAAERYPNGLPEPQSYDPTQWLFHGHPAKADAHAVLQVAVARLLGYRWPPEIDEEMRLADEARAWVKRCDDLAEFADDDGIVCLTSVRGEGSAVDRLRQLLSSAFGDDWSATKERDLLQAAADQYNKGKAADSLDDWLRDRFFEEHCSLFHKRPFIWHIWDGRRDGFNALVNYHKLAGPDGEALRTLNALAFTYLGEWIERQEQDSKANVEGADGRLAAALKLQKQLQRIIDGEPPCDIFVRWKPLHEQPLGWEPDINDGVRLNIRPFLLADDMGKKDAGVLKCKPDNTWSNKKKPGVSDRGKEPQSLRPADQFPWFWGCTPEAHHEHRTDFGAGTPGCVPAGKDFDGVRWNGLHYSRAAKEAARARSKKAGSA